MNIKITIKEGDAQPLLLHKNELSEVESRKKNSLYQQPHRDRPKKDKPPRDEKGLRQTGLRSSGEEEARREGERRLLGDLDKLSKNQASLQMIHNSHSILQRQNEILYENQKAIQQLAKSEKPPAPAVRQREEVEGVLKNIRREVEDMRKIKEEMERASKEFVRTASEAAKSGKQVTFQGVGGVADLSGNLRNLAEISRNQLEGLEGLEAIKGLQSFNIEGYSQAISGLKRQIVQYQKESEQIERELKLRAAKLDQLAVAPCFNEQLLAPYEDYLKKKADAVDLHAIKDRIYEKIGHYDYAKFEYDISAVMSEVRGELKEFEITCKQYRVQVPDIRLDPREIKGLEIKLPNALEEYKAERGIDFAPRAEAQTQELADSRAKKRKAGEAVIFREEPKKKAARLPQAIREINSKPVDLSAQVKYHKTDEPVQKTILQNQRQNDRKEVERNMKKGKVREDEDFEKYLEYRAKEELELIYKEKEQRLKKMKQELLETCKEEPEVYLHLDLQNQIQRDSSLGKERGKGGREGGEERREGTEPGRKEGTGPVRKEEAVEQKQLKPVFGHEGEAIKAIGTEVLKEKLKNILGQANQRRQAQPQPQLHGSVPAPGFPSQPARLQNVAQNFLALINNTLTQVNTQISSTIQSKFQQRSLSKERREYERRSPPKIQIPKLQEFRPPPVFSMPYTASAHQGLIATQPTIARAQQKIVPKNYEHLQIKESLNYGELEISEDSYQQDFE